MNILSLATQHLAGVQNPVVDWFSCRHLQVSEWMLDPHVFQEISFGSPRKDLFDSPPPPKKKTSQRSRFFSRVQAALTSPSPQGQHTRVCLSSRSSVSTCVEMSLATQGRGDSRGPVLGEEASFPDLLQLTTRDPGAILQLLELLSPGPLLYS